ncbi:DUF58 domain-containing protein [Sphingomonas sp. LB-2]|uniref:DUF58 domain-containing protein n=1 Tax=Sphingomonas caeni TaxID=2984949 RepID=UPI0029F500A7|nr:DUF58 domain-containing protein [Sphingomonas caeni]MCW3848203.1 DUF58 domain-containing protein [Sphingomonas caeni]
MAAGAPVALLVGVFAPAIWFAGLVWIPAVLTLLLLDWLFAPRAPRFAVAAPGAVEVGAPVIVAVEVTVKRHVPPGLELALSTGPKLRPVADNRMVVGREEFRPALAFTAVRRGVDAVERLWARWPGPMGLIWRMRNYAVDQEVLIAPNIRQVRDDAQLLLRDAQMGERSRIDRGEGSEFEALTEWQSGMERRDIDWRQSARHLKLFAREYRIERNNQIVFAIDSGRVMCEPVAGLPRVDRAISAALLSAYAALKLGDRVSFFGFDSRPRISSGSVSGVRAFPLIQRFAAKLDYSAVETNFTLALATLAGSLNRRSLVIVFTEFTDQTGAELMLRAAANLLGRHLLLFVVLADEELEELAAAEPKTIDDVSRAVTAAALLRERRLVISRMRHLGIHVIEARHDAVGPALIRQYLDFKRRNLL